MILSMTGYGKHIYENDEILLSVEIKSVNSKFLDPSLRLPKVFSEKEMDIRNLLTERVIRGKVSLGVDYCKKKEFRVKKEINIELLKAYIDQLNEASEFVEQQPRDLFSLALSMPEVFVSNFDENNSDDDWNVFLTVFEKAISSFNQFRKQEGEKTANEFLTYIKNINNCLTQIQNLDEKRIENIRLKLTTKINELNVELDKNRFEQELIFYIEKLDISEEKSRLKNHLNYFLTTMKSDEISGKKLSFISQEIGREINTIGSKANDFEIQKLVVVMKEDLEKIKEQLSNVL